MAEETFLCSRCETQKPEAERAKGRKWCKLCETQRIKDYWARKNGVSHNSPVLSDASVKHSETMYSRATLKRLVKEALARQKILYEEEIFALKTQIKDLEKKARRGMIIEEREQDGQFY